jgi:hypothetical protein
MTRPGLAVLRLVLVTGFLVMPLSAVGPDLSPETEPLSEANVSTTTTSVPGQIGMTSAGRRDQQRSHNRPWASIVFAAGVAALGGLCAYRMPPVPNARLLLTRSPAFSRAPPPPAFA